MRKAGYDPNFSAMVNAVSSPTGMLLPPSNTFIVYSLVSGTSIAALFMAGVGPGLVWALVCIIMVALYARKNPDLKGHGERPTIGQALLVLLRALPALAMIVVVIGGILAGIFTATESAVIAVLYCLALGRIAPGREVLCIDGDFGSVVFPFSVSVFSPDLRVRHVPCEALADEIGPDTGLIAFSLVQSADGALVDAEAVRQAAAEVGAWTYVDTTQAVGWLPVGPDESFDPGQFDVTVCATYKWLCTPRGVTMTSFSTRALEEMQPVHTSWFSGRNLDRSGYGPTVDLADGARRFDVSPPWPQYVGQRVSLDYFTPERIPAIRDHDLGLAARFCQALDLPEPSTPIVSVPDPDEAICRTAAQANLAVSPRNGLARFSFHVYNTDRDVDRAVAAVRSSS